MYIYLKNNHSKTIPVVFLKRNFMHLCGVKYYVHGIKYNASNFYKALKKNRVSQKQLSPRKNGTTGQKLSVINELPLLIKPGVRITGEGNFLHLKFSNALRSSKAILATTLIHNKAEMVPQSLLSLKGNNKSKSKVFMKSYKVIYLKQINIINHISRIIF